MKLATYNLLKGGARRTHWLRLVEDLGVDLLLVQESYSHREHLPASLQPEADRRVAWRPVQGRAWGSAVFSTSGNVAPVRVPGYAGWIAGAELSGAPWQRDYIDRLLIFSIHAPFKSPSYASQVNRILDRIKKIARGREVVIGGDFNLTVSHYPGADRPTCKQDLLIQQRLADEFKLINCWQTMNENQPLHQTLRWSGDRSTAYHCDGMFVPRSWLDRLRSCRVLAGDDWNALSDHNPIVAEFA